MRASCAALGSATALEQGWFLSPAHCKLCREVSRSSAVQPPPPQFSLNDICHYHKPLQSEAIMPASVRRMPLTVLAISCGHACCLNYWCCCAGRLAVAAQSGLPTQLNHLVKHPALESLPSVRQQGPGMGAQAVTCPALRLGDFSVGDEGAVSMHTLHRSHPSGRRHQAPILNPCPRPLIV